MRGGGVATTDTCSLAPWTGSYLVWVMGNNAEVGHGQPEGGVLYDAAPEIVLGTGGEVAAGDGAVVELGLVVIDVSHHNCHQGAGLGLLAVDVQVLLKCLGGRRGWVGGAQGEEEDGGPLTASYSP